MPALQWSRRHLLSVSAGALTVGLGGCATSEDESTETRRDPQSPPDGAITEINSVSVRRDDPEPFVFLDEETDRENTLLVLVDSADVDSLVFEVEPPGTTALREFVGATDFTSETAAIYQSSIGECQRYRPDYVVPSEDDFDLDFCRVLRDADVECTEDERNMVAIAVRLPQAYDERPSSYNYGFGSTCESAFWDETPGETDG